LQDLLLETSLLLRRMEPIQIQKRMGKKYEKEICSSENRQLWI
jgi:hypothetical protein